MAIYTIKAVAGQTRQWVSGRGDEMTSYRLQLDDGNGKMLEAVELSQKSATPAPEPGQTLDAEVSQNGDWGLKAKKNFQQGGFGGGGAARGKSPQESAAIQRMHLQKTAPDWVTFLLTIGVVEQPTTDQEAFKLMRRVMDWLAQDIDRAKQSAA